MGTIHLYGKNVENFKWLLLWSLWANVAQISCGASLGWGNEWLLKWTQSIDQDWPPCPYMLKTFKSLLQNRGCLGAESLHKSSGTGGLPKLLKMMVVHWPLTFLRRGQVCFPVHLYGQHTLVWKKYWEFQTTSPLKPLGQC